MSSKKADHVFKAATGPYVAPCGRKEAGLIAGDDIKQHPWCEGVSGESGCGWCNTLGCPCYIEHEVSAVRKFATGATRSGGTKPDYSGYLSPAAIQRYGEYMLKHQVQEDGTVRGSSNWKLGIPLDSYKESLIRHVIDLWATYEAGDIEAVEDLSCAILFNTQGLLHELIKQRASLDSPPKTK